MKNAKTKSVAEYLLPKGTESYKVDGEVRMTDDGKIDAVFVRYTPKGFWSDVITVRLDGSWAMRTHSVSISSSSGGRDPKEVPSDAEAYDNMAKAMASAAAYAKILEETVAEKKGETL